MLELFGENSELLNHADYFHKKSFIIDVWNGSKYASDSRPILSNTDRSADILRELFWNTEEFIFAIPSGQEKLAEFIFVILGKWKVAEFNFVSSVYIKY